MHTVFFLALPKVHSLKKFLTKSCFSGLAGLGLAHLTSAASTNCDLFEESKLCISHLSNLIYRQPTTDELVCQDLCQSHLACSHFTFMEGSYPLVTGEPDLQCYLWRKCISKAGFIQLLIFSHFPSRCHVPPWTALHRWLAPNNPAWLTPAAPSFSQVSVKITLR